MRTNEFISKEEERFVKTAKKIIKENPEVFDALLEYDRTGRLPTVEETKEKLKNRQKNNKAHST